MGSLLCCREKPAPSSTFDISPAKNLIHFVLINKIIKDLGQS